MKRRCIFILVMAVMLMNTACQPSKNRQHTAEPATDKSAETERNELIISFTQPDMSGRNISVTDEFAKHKITIIDFWASWCGPCRQEMPHLVTTYNKYKDKGLGIIGVSLDEDKAQWIDAVNSMNMTWLQLSDLQGWHNSVAKMYGIQAIPFTIVVDDKGKVIAAGLRGTDLTAFIASRLDRDAVQEKQ